MKQLTCEMCGSNDLVKQDGVFVCQSCGCKYSVEEAKKMMVEGTVKIDNSKKLDNYFQLARTAKSQNNWSDAAKYYDLVRQEDPSNWEAIFFSVYFSALQTNIAGIENATYTISNCISTALKLMKDNIKNSEEIESNVLDICFAVGEAASIFFKATIDHYNQFATVNGAMQEKVERINSIMSMLFTTGDVVEMYFRDDKKIVVNSACECWELAFTCYKSGNIPYPPNGAEYREKLKKYKPESTVGEKSGCYVATCVYGSYDCPQVWTLRRFRDNTLAETMLGRAFIRTYYAISPTLVKWFGDTSWFKKMWKGTLDRMVSKLQANGVEDTPYQDRN